MSPMGSARSGSASAAQSSTTPVSFGVSALLLTGMLALPPDTRERSFYAQFARELSDHPAAGLDAAEAVFALRLEGMEGVAGNRLHDLPMLVEQGNLFRKLIDQLDPARERDSVPARRHASRVRRRMQRPAGRGALKPP